MQSYPIIYPDFSKTLAVCTGGICKLEPNHIRIRSYYNFFLQTIEGKTPEKNGIWGIELIKTPEYPGELTLIQFYIIKLEDMLSDYWQRFKYDKSMIPLFAPVYPHELNENIDKFEWTFDVNGEPVQRERRPVGFILGHQYDNEGIPDETTIRIHPYELYNFLIQYKKIQDDFLYEINQKGKFIVPCPLYYRQINAGLVPFHDELLINMFWAFEKDITIFYETYFQVIPPLELVKFGQNLPEGFTFDFMEIFTCSERRINEILAPFKSDPNINQSLLSNNLWLKKRKNMYMLFALFLYIRFAMYQASAGNISKEEILLALDTFFSSDTASTLEEIYGSKIKPPVDFRKHNLKEKKWKDPEALEKFKDLEIFKLRKNCNLHTLLKQYINDNGFYFSVDGWDLGSKKGHSLWLRRTDMASSQEYDEAEWKMHQVRKRELSTKKVIGDLDPDGNNVMPVRRRQKLNDEVNICSLCLQEIQKSETVVSPFNCVHILHKECFDQWPSTVPKNCPTCRADLLGDPSMSGGSVTKKKEIGKKYRILYNQSII